MNVSKELLIRVRLIIFVLSVAISVGYWYHRIEIIRVQYQNYEKEQNADCIKTYDCKSAFVEMAKQNDLFINLVVATLGGVAAMVTITRVHPIAYLEWVYLLLAPTASFLIGSLWAGIVFRRRFTYLAFKNYELDKSLNDLMKTQSDLFEYAIFSLSIFAGIFLLNIVVGRVTPSHHDVNKETL